MDIFEIIGTIIGFTYLFLEYRRSILLWPVGIVMSIFYVIIFYMSKFYADSAIYLYYLFANIYGWIVWKQHQQEDNTKLEIKHLSLKRAIYSLLIFIGLWMILYGILITWTDSPIALGDAFTTSLSIIATWWLTYKYWQHWFLWIIVNAVSTILYFSKGLYPTALFFTVYTITSVLGLFKWRKDLKILENNEL